MWLGLLASSAAAVVVAAPAFAQQQKRPNIVMLMTDDTGWQDFGAYTGGGAALGHPTPNVDQIAKEGAVFTSWYGQASCTAGRASFLTGRIPIRSALSIVVAPGDENYLHKETPTIAEFFQKNGYSVYFSGKWHLGDKPAAYPTEHGFDEMKNFAAYYAGVYAYNDTAPNFHPWFPSFNRQFNEMFDSVVNLGEWEGVAGQPARKVGTISYDSLATFDIRQADNAVADIGRIMEAIRAQAPNTIVIVTADNGAWVDAYPDAGTSPFRGEKGTPFEGGWRVPGIMWWPGHIPAGRTYNEMMSHIDSWTTLAAMVGLTPPPHDWVGNDGKPIYFDSIDNSAYILGTEPHSARTNWVYIDGEQFYGVRADIGDDPAQPWLHIAWKYLYTAKDSWLGVTANLGAIGSIYNHGSL
jgi:arylsulfatase A-like enzyme